MKIILKCFNFQIKFDEKWSRKISSSSSLQSSRINKFQSNIKAKHPLKASMIFHQNWQFVWVFKKLHSNLFYWFIFNFISLIHSFTQHCCFFLLPPSSILFLSHHFAFSDHLKILLLPNNDEKSFAWNKNWQNKIATFTYHWIFPSFQFPHFMYLFSFIVLKV